MKITVIEDIHYQRDNACEKLDRENINFARRHFMNWWYVLDLKMDPDIYAFAVPTSPYSKALKNPNRLTVSKPWTEGSYTYANWFYYSKTENKVYTNRATTKKFIDLIMKEKYIKQYQQAQKNAQSKSEQTETSETDSPAVE